jgi:hypothetical protein
MNDNLIRLTDGSEITLLPVDGAGFRFTYDAPDGLHLAFPLTSLDVRELRQLLGLVLIDELHAGAQLAALERSLEAAA